MSKTNKHHVVPRSRLYDDCHLHHDNVVEWDMEFHDLFHRLFDNMTVLEIHRFIEEISVPGTKWTRRDLERLKLKLMERKPKQANLCSTCTRTLKKKGKRCVTCRRFV